MVAILCALTPSGRAPVYASTDVTTPWPPEFQGLQELEQTPQERRYFADFPGRLGRFRDGANEIVVRLVTSKTRRLHPAADCFRGLGYAIEDQGLERDGQGRRWHVFRACTSGKPSLRVRERISCQAQPDQEWTDVSEWYWSSGPGPWWAVCQAREEPRR